MCLFYSVFYLYGAAACQLFIKRICYVTYLAYAMLICTFSTTTTPRLPHRDAVVIITGEVAVFTAAVFRPFIGQIATVVQAVAESVLRDAAVVMRTPSVACRARVFLAILPFNCTNVQVLLNCEYWLKLGSSKTQCKGD